MVKIELLKIKNNILSNYNEYLKKEDIGLLNNNPSEIDLRKIVNKIWYMYLTDPFKQERYFKYLVKKNDMIFMEPVDYLDYPVFQDRKHYLEILSSNNILDECGGRLGFTVNVDWMKTDKIYLPNELSKEGKYIETKLIPSSIFCVNIGEGIVDPGYDFALYFANKNDILFLDINKLKYNNNYKFSLGDNERIVSGLISAYLENSVNAMNLKEHERLRKAYKKVILDKFKHLIKNNSFNDNFFIQEMKKIIDQKENVNNKSL
ncbi:MAG: hypothetical protein PHF21_04850 [Bacilli bacterium]|nr:hypothetical protein [Bacilli bacterium]